MITDIINYSLKNLRKRKLRSWLTMIGIFIGIASVVSLISLGEGLRTAISGQFGSMGSDLLSTTASGGFGPPGTGVVSPLKVEYVNKIQSLKEVKQTAGRLLVQSQFEYNNKVQFGMVVSIPDGDARKLVETAVGYEAEEGRMLKDSDTNSVVLGYSVADEKTFDKKVSVGSKIKINDKMFKVVGIAEKTGSFMFDTTIIMNENDVRDLFDRNDDSYDVIASKIDPSYTIDEAQAAIEKLLRRERNVDIGDEDFQVESPQSIVESLNSTMFAIQLFVYIIASISLVVGGIGIMTTMYTAVVERTKEIGIMKSIGAKNNVIFTMFFFESGFLGLTGGIIGVIIGSGMALGLSAAGRALLGSDLIQATLHPSIIFGALAFSFILGSFFGTFPAYKASKMHPVEALRFIK